MTDHSPDHAERAALQQAWDATQSLPPLIFTDSEANALIAALRGRDAVVEDLTIALHDAIRRPAGVVPESAEPFYDWRRYDRAPSNPATAPSGPGDRP